MFCLASITHTLTHGLIWPGSLKAIVYVLLILNAPGLLVNGDIPDKQDSWDYADSDPLDTSKSEGVDTPFGRSLYPPVDVRPCEGFDGNSENSMPLPKLDEQFQAKIEAKILQRDYTVEVEEFYDFPNNRGAIRRMKAGVLSTYLYNFKHYESFLMIGSTCWLSDMRQEGFQFFNFTLGGNGGHISGVTDLFSFGTMYNETYVSGNETVRGIPVNHWTSCIEWQRYSTMFQLDYYFTKPDYLTSIGQKQIPVRAVLRGQALNGDDGLHTFHHIYDFMFYRPGPIRDTSVFEVPRGTVCRHKTMEKRRPDLPDSFQMDVEMVQPEDRVVSLRKYFYDYNLKLSRYDLTPNTKSMMSWGEEFGFRPLTLIHDYQQGTQYVIDEISRNCSVSPITIDTVDADPRMADPSHVMMRHGRELFDLDQLNFFYQGKRSFRAMTCEVWAAVRLDWPQEGTNTTVEVYFTQENWTTDQTAGNQQVIVGIWLILKDSMDNYVSEWVNHIYEYRQGDPDLCLFDISDCYTENEKLIAGLSVKASMVELKKHGLSNTKQAIHQKLSELAAVSPVRIANLQLIETAGDFTEVSFIMLDESSAPGTSSKSGKATDAYQTLSDKVNGEQAVSILVTSPQHSQSYSVVAGSLRKDSVDTDDASSPVHKHDSHMYSSGSMAGLGFTMLLMGAAGGAAAVFFLKVKKRPIDIPYRVQD